MASSSSDLAGVQLIKRAIEHDTNKRYADALVCYSEGIEILIGSMKSRTFKFVDFKVKQVNKII